jgi:hypothetical protein
LRQAAALHPKEVKPHLDLGTAYMTDSPDKAEAEFRRVLELDAKNKEAYYSLGMIAWSKWYPAWLAARAKLNMTPQDSGPLPDPIRRDLKEQYFATIEEGIANLDRALRLDPNYSEAMTSLNLLIAGRADLRDTKEEYAKDIAVAKERQKAMEATKALPKPLLPPAPPSIDGSPTRIRVGGAVQAAHLIRKVSPEYPKEARKAHVSGQVRFTVIVGRDGTILAMQLVSGPPLLVDAARDAVSQWVYKPSRFDGHPVEVITLVDVNFALSP